MRDPDTFHDFGYRIRWQDTRWAFRRPDGSLVPTVAEPLSGNAESLTDMHTRARLRIDRPTPTPNWDGDRLDVEPILDALLLHRIAPRPNKVRSAERATSRSGWGGRKDRHHRPVA